MSRGNLIVGVDLGATKCLVVWVDPSGAVAHRERFASPDRPEALIDQIQSLIADRPASTLGVGVAGFIDKSRKRILRCPNLPHFVDVPFVSALEAKVGVQVLLENDANAAALAEFRAGVGRGHADQVFVSLGTGVGGGLIANGQIVRGEGFAGEIGHLTVDPNGPLCTCGRKGCWEVYASGRALAQLGGVGHGEQVHEALQAGEAWAQEILPIYADRVAEGLSGLVMMMAPSLVVLGGGVSRIGHSLAELVQGSLNPRIPAGLKVPDVRIAALGDEAGAIGAALGRLLPGPSD